MTAHERAAQLWPLLVFAARTQQILSYSMVEKMTGIPRPAVGGFLGPIQDYCKHNDLPPLTALVVNEEQGLPGEGFVGADLKDIFKAQARVFVFDWFKNRPPSPEELKKTDHHSLSTKK